MRKALILSLCLLLSCRQAPTIIVQECSCCDKSAMAVPSKEEVMDRMLRRDVENLGYFRYLRMNHDTIQGSIDGTHYMYSQVPPSNRYAQSYYSYFKKFPNSIIHNTKNPFQ